MQRCLCCRFAKPFKLRCCAAFGGLQKYAQVKSLQSGQEVAVATPGRLIDLVKSQACDFKRVTMLVVDEVDRCFDLGFEAQVRTDSNLGSRFLSWVHGLLACVKMVCFG